VKIRWVISCSPRGRAGLGRGRYRTRAASQAVRVDQRARADRTLPPLLRRNSGEWP